MSTLSAIGAVRPRDHVHVAGRVVSIEVQPRDAQPRLSARVSDGTGVIDAIFLGQRTIAGLTPGIQVSLSGRLSVADGTPRLYNPRFELG